MTTVTAAPRTRALARLTTAGAVVPLVDGTNTRYVNLDLAASAPPLVTVLEAVTRAAGTYASVHRGAGWGSQISTAAYETARRRIGAFVGARTDDVTIITRNTTDALTLLAGAVPGDVVHLDVEHHANLLPWRGRARVVRAGSTFEATMTALAAELGAAPAALLTVTGASNVTGELLPLRRLADLAHAHGARLAVDGAQLVPHRPVDMAATGIDYLALSGHKLYAPFGAGALIGRRDWLDVAQPHQPGGGAVSRVTLEHTDWAPSPARHEGGTPNILGAVALAAACDQITAIGWPSVIEHERQLTGRLVDGVRGLGIEPLRIWPEADTVGLATFTVPGLDAAVAAAALSAEYGVGVRDGRFCAHPLLDRLGAARGAVRASLGLGSSDSDVSALLDALEQLIEHGPRWRYLEGDGVVSPSPDPRPLPGWAGATDVVPPCAGDKSSLPTEIPEISPSLDRQSSPHSRSAS